MSKIVTDQTRFKRNALALLGIFIDYFDELDEDNRVDMTGINLAHTVVDNMDKEDLIVNFITNSNSHWNHLFTKDNKFLLSNALLLVSDKYKKKLKPYIEVLTGEDDNLLMNNHEITNAWIYMHNMIKCSIRYASKKKINDINLDLDSLIKKWNIDLNKIYIEESSEGESSDSSSNNE